MGFLKKNWLVILVGCLSAVLGVLTLLTVVKLKKTTPVAPTAPESKPKAVIPASTLTFKLSLADAAMPTPTSNPTEELSSTLTPTETPTAIPTPISEPNDIPICTELSANLTSGEVPLKVSFTGSGVDQDGKITAFEFSFGDGEAKTVEKDVEGPASHSIDHTYSSSGIYWASVRVRDNNNAWSEIPESCKVKIEVKEISVGLGGEEATPTAGGATLTPILAATPTTTATATLIPVPELPESGVSLPTILTILSGSLLLLLGILL